MTKIVILGSKGMLGSSLESVFAQYGTINYDKNSLDITDSDSLCILQKKIKPDIVINAAAYTNVDRCETEKKLARKINGEAVGSLAQICNRIDALLVHFSTDYVFDGKKKEGYEETDRTNPINFYGKSKKLGEKLLQKNTKKFLLIRTSWLFGANGKNFVDTIFEKSKIEKELKVVDDQMGSPTYTIDLANATKSLIEGKKQGIYHITNTGSCSWADFAQEIVIISKHKTKIIRISSTEYPRPAKRPHYSILKNTKIPNQRPWQKAVYDYLSTKL